MHAGVVNHGNGNVGHTIVTKWISHDDRTEDACVDLQKLRVPKDMRIIARPTKQGPAAPVIRSAKRSKRLKHRKIRRAQVIGMQCPITKIGGSGLEDRFQQLTKLQSRIHVM